MRGDARKRIRKLTFLLWSSALFLVLLWNVSIILAPIASKNGFEQIASFLYKSFSYTCHQIETRSLNLSGNKLAVCSRCFGFYFGFLLGLVFYPLFRSIENPEPISPLWLILSMIPIGLDWLLGVIGVWENTHLSRSITGLILGIVCAACIVPVLTELAYFLSFKKLRSKLKF